jgi:hypothetical protein
MVLIPGIPFSRNPIPGMPKLAQISDVLETMNVSETPRLSEDRLCYTTSVFFDLPRGYDNKRPLLDVRKL